MCVLRTKAGGKSCDTGPVNSSASRGMRVQTTALCLACQLHSCAVWYQCGTPEMLCRSVYVALFLQSSHSLLRRSSLSELSLFAWLLWYSSTCAEPELVSGRKLKGSVATWLVTLVLDYRFTMSATHSLKTCVSNLVPWHEANQKAYYHLSSRI